MAIETKIEGDPGSIQASVEWLRGTYRSAIGDVTSSATGAIAGSADSWIGDAADAFRAELADRSALARQIEDGVDTVANGFDRYGDALRNALRRMREIRDTAAGAGLELTATQILPPGPMPALPAALPDVVTAAQRALHQAAVEALEDYRRKVAAYQTASGDAEKVMTDLYSALKDLVKIGTELNGLAERLKSADLSKADDLLETIRKGTNFLKPVDYGLTAIESVWAYFQGEPPTEIAIRTVGDELGFFAELASNHPRVEALLRKAGIDYDFDKLGEDFVALYRELPPEVREELDRPLANNPRVQAMLRRTGLDDYSFEQLRDDVKAGVLEGLVKANELRDDVIDGATDKLEDAKDLAEDGIDKLGDIKDGVDAGLDKLDEVTPGFGVKPNLPFL